MPVSSEYIVRETATNLWRNRLTTLAAMLTVAISLSLVGAALLVRQGAAQAEGIWQRDTQVTVWMQPTASTSEIAAIGTQLKTLAFVDQPCVFRNHTYDYRQSKRLLGVVITESGLTPATTPTSWRCTPVHLQDANAIIAKFKGQAGVQTVTAPLSTIHSQEEIINWVKYLGLGIALLLLASAGVLILNTIRMAIFARRREVSVMKLVGATNWFIRLPFMSEGMVQGLIGSAVAAGVVFLMNEMVNIFGNPIHHRGSLLVPMRMTGFQVLGTEVVVVLVGVLVGTIGSAIAIRRFLDV